MLLFRSEEHMDRWLEQSGEPRGGLITLAQLRAMAQEWYARKLEPGWRRHTREEAQAFFDSIGLSGPFWQLAPTGKETGPAG